MKLFIIIQIFFIKGWAGDSRAVICKNGVAFALTRDHKPDHLEERARIREWLKIRNPRDLLIYIILYFLVEKAGGFVENICGQYRANGNLNLSRAIGGNILPAWDFYIYFSPHAVR
jgi:hypothetical protein